MLFVLLPLLLPPSSSSSSSASSSDDDDERRIIASISDDDEDIGSADLSCVMTESNEKMKQKLFLLLLSCQNNEVTMRRQKNNQ